MNKTLQEQIAARKKEMEDKDIGTKTWLIAAMLGHRSSQHKDGCEETWDRFKNERFEIEEYGISCTDAGGFHRWVKYNGKQVFYQAGGGEESFIPGEWEKEFNQLYTKAQRKERQIRKEAEANKKRQEKSRELQERKKWGL